MHLRDGGLPRAALADQRERLARADVEVDPVDGGEDADATLAGDPVLLDEAGDGEGGPLSSARRRS